MPFRKQKKIKIISYVKFEFSVPVLLLPKLIGGFYLFFPLIEPRFEIKKKLKTAKKKEKKEKKKRKKQEEEQEKKKLTHIQESQVRNIEITLCKKKNVRLLKLPFI